jgi:lipid II:glycine glycyltransferase (peptidoglycan interpeptide bridge formation enzyme)
VSVREADDADLAAWEARTVQVPGGHVYQSRAWAEHRSNSGWSSRFLVFDDEAAALVLLRPWSFIGGASAYVPRGPVSAGQPAARTADRLAELTAYLARDGVDVVATDSEIPAATGYRELLRDLGFRPIPEIQPSRHRLSLALPPEATDDTIQAGFAKSTRQRIKGAQGGELGIARYDTAGWIDEEGLFAPPARPLDDALDAFYSLLETTGGRRGFRFGPRTTFVPWWRLAHDRGLLVYLEANDRGGEAVGGLLLYRHGQRLTTVHSGDRDTARSEHPGLMHLLRWRAIQLALRERCVEMDLGGVDIGPDHRLPTEGDPMFGLYEHKRSFGAEWIEMSGAHERVLRPWRYAVGRVASRAGRAIAARASGR